MTSNPSPPSGRRQSSVPSKESAALPVSTIIGLGVAVLAVLFIALFSYRALESRTETGARLTHSLKTIELLETVVSTLKDAETGQRGFLLTGDESYLEPFVQANMRIGGQLDALYGLAEDDERRRELSEMRGAVGAKLAELTETIELRRAGKMDAALDVVRTDRGKAAMDRLRSLVERMQTLERERGDSRRREWDEAVTFSSWVNWTSSALLLACIMAAGVIMSRDYRARERQQWLQLSQMELATRMQGEQRLERLGDNVLQFLAPLLDAQLAAIYIAEPGGGFRRFAGYALPADEAGRRESVRPGDGLLGQVIEQARALRVKHVPADYFRVESSLGGAKPRELLLAPAMHEGMVQAVLELGFFHEVHDADLALLEAASESIGVAVRSAKDRSRLEELLEETQRQAEELQAQQEELRVSNEELEEQGRVLKESQARLENQQAELEQTNSQLEEQAQILESQKEDLWHAQRVLRDKAAELERANRYKGEFLANMSHELRTPLNSSLILAKLLADNKDGNLTPEQVRFAQTISSAGNDLLALINDILDLSRIEAGKIDLQIEEIPLRPALDALMKTLQPIAREKGLDLVSAIELGAPERVVSDGQRLGQILKNLLSNALKFTEQGTVSLSVLGSADGGLSFVVRDTGIGIPEAQHEAIFEAFRQADGSTHRKYGGTGLGLSISRDLARRLGGDIAVQSAPGAGSTFTLTLPQRYREPASEPAHSQPLASRPVNEAPAGPPSAARPVERQPAPPEVEDDRERLNRDSRTILVVEDDVRFAGVLRDLVRELGYRCVVAHTARDGVAAASSYRVAAVLLDMNLPDHSGLSVLEQLKTDPTTRHVPVHIVSVDDFSQEALARGAVGYAVKPVKREELVQAIRRLEQKFSQGLRRVLVVEDDANQRDSVRQLLSTGDVQIVDVDTAGAALAQLKSSTFDCMVMDLSLPDLSGYELLEQMSAQDDIAFPPVIVYTGRSLSAEEEQRLRRFSKSIIIKDARSPERLLDEVTLFLHQMETKLPPDQQRMLKEVRKREAALEGKRVLVVEDDVRNVFALTSLLEPKGVEVQIARNGKEALAALESSAAQPDAGVDLVLMDLMMPEMDGLTAMREIRKRPEWRKLPIIALTAKAMKDDQQQSLGAGANDYIAKPLDVEKLLSLIRVWMPK